MTTQILAPPTENTQPRTPVLFTPERAAEIVAGWIEDPIDRWRKQHKKYDRVWVKKGDDLPAHLRLAGETVERVAARLTALGYRVAPSKTNVSWDLTVEDCLYVEVKGSAWHNNQKGKRGRYQANIRARQAVQADLVIFVAINGDDHYFIIPRTDLRGRRSLTIRTYSPEHYTGCLAEFREAWHLVGPALETAKERPYQERLEL